MPSFLTPDILLALAKITALLLVILALAPQLGNPVHRARLWTGTILVLPLVFLTSFSTPLLGLIPRETKANLPADSPKGKARLDPVTGNRIPGQPILPDGFGITPHDRSGIDANGNPIQNVTSIGDHSDLWPTGPDGQSGNSPGFQKTNPLTNSGSRSQAIPVHPPSAGSTNDLWLAFILIQGAMITLLPFLISSLRIFRMSKSKALDPPLSFWQKIHRSAGKTPPLFFTPSPAAPFACGFITPRLILPDDSPTWPHRQLKSTLLHEAAHLRRRDPLIRFLATLVRAAFWFHPLVWIARRQLIAAQEQACDQAALSHGIAPDDYAEDLLSSVTHSHLTPTDALSMAKWSQLGNRVRHVLEKPRPTSMPTITLTTTTAIIATFVLTAIGFSQESARPIPPTTPEIKVSKPTRGAILDRQNKPIVIDGPDGKRTYPFGESLAHVSGYLREPGPDQPDRRWGVYGLEKSYDALLSQKKNVRVTLNATIQKHCYNLLATQKFPGSIVIQNPNSGEIIAMVSYPSFDPNLFIPTISHENFKRLQKNKQNPLFDRSLGLFTPGSVAKPLVALAGEYKGLNNPEIHCIGFLQIGRLKIRDWKPDRDELFRIPGALEQSCNTYFMKLGIRAGHDAMADIGKLLHLNESPLESTPASKGQWMVFPSEESPDDATLATTAIGQGRTLMSPLHISTITSAIASGSWHQPHLTLGQEKTKPSVSLIGQGEITAESLKVIREGMHLTIHGKRGTAQRAAIPGLQLAGKTGTAQISKNRAPTHNSWFTGYGPYGEPQYSVTVMLSGADSGGRFAAPLAASVFKQLLKTSE